MSLPLGALALLVAACTAWPAATPPQRAAILCMVTGGGACGALLATTEAGQHLDAGGWLLALALGLAVLARLARGPLSTPAAQEMPLP